MARKGVPTAGNHGHAQINTVTAKIRSLFTREVLSTIASLGSIVWASEDGPTKLCHWVAGLYLTRKAVSLAGFHDA